MVQVAEELVEAVDGRQVLVLVADVVLPELPAHVTQRFEELGDCRVLGLKADVGARQADFRQTRGELVTAP